MHAAAEDGGGEDDHLRDVLGRNGRTRGAAHGGGSEGRGAREPGVLTIYKGAALRRPWNLATLVDETCERWL